MVGVPRSKGCRICVQRRVKCDQTRPTCNNCKKGNRPCPGYGTDMKFQDEGPKLRKRYAKKQTSADSSDEDENSSSRSESQSVWQLHRADELQLEPPDPFEGVEIINPPLIENRPSNEWEGMLGLDLGLELTSNRPFGDVYLPADGEEVFDDSELTFGKGYLSEFIWSATHGKQKMGAALTATGVDVDSPLGWLTLYKQLHMQGLDMNRFHSPQSEQMQLFAIFTDSMAPTSQKLAPAYRNNGKWLSRLPDLMDQFPLLDTAIRAVTLAHLSMQTHSKHIMRESSPYYGKALHLLNKALLDDSQGLRSETLSATILLSFYEMFSSEKNESWVRHAGGAGTLMRIRGAARHRYGLDREMFLAYRHALIIEAFEQDKPCFLNEPEWRQVAIDIHEDIRASGITGSGNPLFDISEEFFMEMITIPATCADARILPSLSVIGGGQHQDIKAEVRDRAKQHRSNMKTIQARFSAALRISGQAPTRRMTNDAIVPTRIDYFNIFIASSHTGYWTVLMLVNAFLRELDRDSEDAPFYKMENRECALECCRSSDYMETSSFLGPFFVIFALRMAWNWLEPREEKLWVVDRLRRIGERNMSMAKGGLPMIQADPGAQVAQAPLVRAAVEELDLLEKSKEQMIIAHHDAGRL